MTVSSPVTSLRRQGWISKLTFCLSSFMVLTAAPIFGIDPKDKPTEPPILGWTDIRALGIEGRGWNETRDSFDRLPAKAESMVRPPVWNMSRHTSGLLVRFVTDATNIYARWSLMSSNLAIPNMTAIGVSGLDLYVKTSGGDWRWAGVGQPRELTNTVSLTGNISPGTREFLLYLPLYNDVTSVEIGVPTNAVVNRASVWGKGDRKPIVFYGTSILNGFSASRPGMVHSAILGRRFNWPTINLGFSGQGRMEPELADLLAELDPAVYVLDCLPNMSTAEVANRVSPFVHRLRQTHPTTPIVLVEDRVWANAFLNTSRAERHVNNHTELRKVFKQLQGAGVKQLYYIPGDHLFGDDGEGSVDGSHPSDLGFMRQADVFAKVLKPLLKAK